MAGARGGLIPPRPAAPKGPGASGRGSATPLTPSRGEGSTGGAAPPRSPSSTTGGVVRTPARPGPGPMAPALLRALDVTVRRRVDGLLAGEHRAAALGAGTELAQVRPYVPGDDVRRMDWNVTARTRVPHVRVHVAERAVVTWLVLDTSPSMTFGTADRRKADVAEGVALAVGHLATRRGNHLGLVVFGGRALRVVPPRQGQRGLLGALAAARDEPEADSLPPGAPRFARPRPSTHDDTQTRSGATTLREALRLTGRVARRRGVVVVVSDFREPAVPAGRRRKPPGLGSEVPHPPKPGFGWRRPLLALAGRHDVVAVEVRDPREQALPDIGEVTFVDPETGQQVRVDTSSRTLRERFAAAAAAERAEVARALRSTGAHHVVLSTSGDWLRILAGALRSLRLTGARR